MRVRAEAGDRFIPPLPWVRVRAAIREQFRMKFLVMPAVALLLAFGALAGGPAAAEESKTLQPTARQKIVHDPAEFKAYMDAVHIKNAAERGAAMERFMAKYPKSVVDNDALQQAMAAYQAAGDRRKVVDLGERLLKSEPDNMQGLAIMAYIKMNQDTAAAAAEGKAYAERGLELLARWHGVPGMPPAQFKTMRAQTAAIFYGAIGVADLFAKDYAGARAALLRAEPAEVNGFADPYRLAVAELEPTPPDPKGFWYVAKSIDMARRQDPGVAPKIEAYGKAKYTRYHGSEDGWDALVAAAAKEKSPPRNFTVKPGAPSAR